MNRYCTLTYPAPSLSCLTSSILFIAISIKVEFTSSLAIGSEALWNILLKEVWNNLMGLKKCLDKGIGNIRVTIIVKRGSKTLVSNTTSAS